VSAAAIVDRWRAGLGRRPASEPVPLSGWAWTADVLLGTVVAASTLLYTVKAEHRVAVGATPTILTLPGNKLEPVLQPPLIVGPREWLLAVLCGLPLIVRRRYPLAAFWLVLVASLLFHARIDDADTAIFTFAACLIGAYSAAMYSPYRRSAVVSVAVGAALIAGFHDTNVPDITAGYLPFLLVIAMGLGANTIHTWKQRVRSLELQQETTTRLAVEEERARIARELHDVVTHNVSVMVIQAGAARKVMDAEPAQARDALLAVEAGGRAALSELRHVMDLLTATGEESGEEPTVEDLTPQPGLEQLETMVDRVRGTGVRVDLAVSGTPSSLPAGVDLAAYRVVQEGLTNAVKHAAGASVHVVLDYEPEQLRVQVSDSGGSPSRAVGPGNGRGLLGLRERLAVLGGTLDAGPLLTGGYRVRAVLPLEGR
jgi:signal transduction histidine kinase